MQKRPFLLIEVFIAFSLLSLSSFIFTNSQHKLFAKEKKKILDLEFERFVEMEYIELRRKVRKELSWNQLSSEETKKHYTSTLFKPKIKQLGICKYDCHYHFYYKKQDDAKPCNLFVKYCYELKPNSCFSYVINGCSTKKIKNNYKFKFFVVKKQKNPV